MLLFNFIRKYFLHNLILVFCEKNIFSKMLNHKKSLFFHNFFSQDQQLENSVDMDSAYLSQISGIDRPRENSISLPAQNNTLNTTPTNSKYNGRRRASMFDPIDPTELQKTLYQNHNPPISQQNSTGSDYSTTGDSVGTIEFGVQYLSDSQKLIVDVLRVFDLTLKESSANSVNTHLFSKCTLMPDKLTYQTNLVHNTSANLIFEEQFEFDYIESTQLEASFIEVSLYEFDKNSKEDCLGSCVIKLNYSNVGMKKIFVKDLKPYSKINEENYIGELMFSLAYLPAAERLTIVVMKARNLKCIGALKQNMPDPCVKVSIINRDGKKLKKKKTSTQKSSTSPVFNEEIVFTNLKKEQLDEIIINFTILHDSLTNRESLGNVLICSSSKGHEYIQWKDMIDGKKSIAWWHTLIPSILVNAQTNYLLATSLNNSFNKSEQEKTSPKRNSSERKNSSKLTKTINLTGLKINPLSILSHSNKTAVSEHS